MSHKILNSNMQRPVKGRAPARTLFILFGAALFLTTTSAAVAESPNTGKVSYFIGHSFFAPIAAYFNDLATEGTQLNPPVFHGHDSSFYFKGGSRGSPENLWKNTSDHQNIQNRLSAGDVELFGMTYYPDMALDTTYYELWIDEALSYNPDTDIFIGLPWPPGVAGSDPNQVHAEHVANTDLFYDEIISLLRASYPATDIYYISYGLVVTQMLLEYSRDQMSDIQFVVLPSEYDHCIGPWGNIKTPEQGCNYPYEEVENAARSSLFLDAGGHASIMAKHIMALIWLHFLYHGDLATLTNMVDPGYDYDELWHIVTQVIEDNRDIVGPYNTPTPTITPTPTPTETAVELPTILLAGYWDTQLSANTPGTLTILALAQGADHVHLYTMGGISTGVEIPVTGDPADGVFQLNMPVGAVGGGAVKLLMELSGSNQTYEGDFWPYLTVTDGGAEEDPQAHLGYRKAALLGSSLFYPSAGVIDDLARFAGYTNHVGQYVEPNTGIGGAPWKVWEEYFDENDVLRPEKIGVGLVDGHIKQGGVELLAMTYSIKPENLVFSTKIFL